MSTILRLSPAQFVTNEATASCPCNMLPPAQPCDTCWLQPLIYAMGELKAGHVNSFHFKEDNAPVQHEPIETFPQLFADKPMSYEPEELVVDVGFGTALTFSRSSSTSSHSSTSRRSSKSSRDKSEPRCGVGARGESMPTTRKRLSVEIKRMIRDGRLNEKSYQELADELGCSKSSAWRIITGIRHKDQMARKKDLQRAHTMSQMTHTMPQMLDLQRAHTMPQMTHTMPQTLDPRMLQMVPHVVRTLLYSEDYDTNSDPSSVTEDLIGYRSSTQSLEAPVLHSFDGEETLDNDHGDEHTLLVERPMNLTRRQRQKGDDDRGHVEVEQDDNVMDEF
ncbi:MAG: hypothetical protein J3Q66DRAFT_416124 [Benniella sp.]|nr:MAG: hypothetical protein J3Q66DRAFT_416124 [Benniella sp.]